jgi:predicted RNase H-like HicB family nuclease
LDDLTTQGETLEEAKEMAKDVIDCYIGGLLKDGLTIPREKKKYKPIVEKIHLLVNVP